MEIKGIKWGFEVQNDDFWTHFAQKTCVCQKKAVTLQSKMEEKMSRSDEVRK